MLALVMVSSALVIALGFGELFGWDIGLTASMSAGSMTWHRVWSVLAIRYIIPVWKAGSCHWHWII
ncbi:hypothetical protein ACNKHV_04950 [Shigella flexneri]